MEIKHHSTNCQHSKISGHDKIKKDEIKSLRTKLEKLVSDYCGKLLFFGNNVILFMEIIQHVLFMDSKFSWVGLDCLLDMMYERQFYCG